MTPARRRDLHVAVNPGRWADHALRLGQFVAQWSRTATAHGWRLAVEVGRACCPLLGRRVLGRLRQHHTCRCEANERCNDQNGQAQSRFLTHLRSVFVNVPRRNTFPPPTAEGAPGHLTFAQKAVAVCGSAATVLARTGRTEIVGTA